MVNPYLPAFAPWNKAQERAQAAYDEAPDAWAQVLDTICSRCAGGQHSRCRRTKSAGCGCRARRHPSRAWWG